MKGYRFYAELPEERKNKSASKKYPCDPWTVARLKTKAADNYHCTLVAVILDNNRPLYLHGYKQGQGLVMEAMSACLADDPMSYAVGGISGNWLGKRTVRVPESLARQLSPEMFHRLEN